MGLYGQVVDLSEAVIFQSQFGPEFGMSALEDALRTSGGRPGVRSGRRMGERTHESEVTAAPLGAPPVGKVVCWVFQR